MVWLQAAAAWWKGLGELLTSSRQEAERVKGGARKGYTFVVSLHRQASSD